MSILKDKIAGIICNESSIAEVLADAIIEDIIAEIKGMPLPWPLKEDTPNGNVANFTRQAIIARLEAE